jgi:excisionase family DNA binding protein
VEKENIQNDQRFVESLSPRDLATAMGVSESSVKRWVDDGRIRAFRTPGGHRRIAVAEAVQFVRESGTRLVRPELVGLRELRPRAPGTRGGDDLNATGDALFDALVDGDAVKARAIVVGAFVEGARIVELCDGPIRVAMHRIGEIWNHDRAGVFLEHRATSVVVEILGRLRSLTPARPDAPRAVGGAPSGDPYLIPTLAAAAVLSEEGFDATNLGPETPVTALELAIKKITPAVVWISASTERSVPVIEAGLDSIAATCRGLGASLAIGGRALEGRALGIESRSVHCRSLAEMAAFTRGLQLRAEPSGS